MIFVTVGTTAFDSLIRRVDQLAAELGEEFICQIADGRYLPGNCAYFRFKATLESEIGQAELVICHGGAGTLFRLMQSNKKVISVPNLERADQHQRDLVDTLSAGAYIVCCYHLAELPDKIAYSRSTPPASYQRPPCTIAEEIARFIGD